MWPVVGCRSLSTGRRWHTDAAGITRYGAVFDHIVPIIQLYRLPFWTRLSYECVYRTVWFCIQLRLTFQQYGTCRYFYFWNLQNVRQYGTEWIFSFVWRLLFLLLMYNILILPFKLPVVWRIKKANLCKKLLWHSTALYSLSTLNIRNSP